MQIALGVLGVTWLPIGAACASVIFAAGARHYPKEFLDHYTSNVCAFWITVALGWICFAMLLLLVLEENKFSGLAVPGKQAREIAERSLAKRLTAS